MLGAARPLRDAVESVDYGWRRYQCAPLRAMRPSPRSGTPPHAPARRRGAGAATDRRTALTVLSARCKAAMDHYKEDATNVAVPFYPRAALPTPIRCFRLSGTGATDRPTCRKAAVRAVLSTTSLSSHSSTSPT